MFTKFNFWLILFAASSCSAILVNKYVLWMLQFTYPTIYQSWQMFVAAFLLLSLYYIGFVQLEVVTKSTILSWIPAIILFTISIYSGSKALAKLPVPIFCFIQQKLFICAIQMINVWKGKRVSLFSVWTISESVSCVLIVLIYDDKFTMTNYQWVFIHCFSVFAYSFYALCVVHKQIKEIDKMVINSTCSILLLLLSGLLSGETISVLQFQHLYKSHFHFACICSGVCGTIIMISYCKLCQHVSILWVRFYNVFVMLFVSIISLFVFQTVLSFHLLSIILIGFIIIIGQLYYQLIYLESGNVKSDVVNKLEIFEEDGRKLMNQISITLFSSPSS